MRMIPVVLIVLGGLVVVGLLAAAQTGAGGGSPYAQWRNGPGADPGYFPIAVWLQGPENATRYQAAGINLYVGLWQGPTAEQLAALKAANMPVICEQNELGLQQADGSTIVGWMHGDEPDNAQAVTDPNTGEQGYGPCIPPERIVADYERMRAADPTRPIMLNLGQGVANDEWIGRGSGAKLDDHLTYVRGGDIISFDVYPVVGISKPDGENYLWYVAKGVSRLREWSGGHRIIWNCLECTHIGEADKKATPHQVRAETWMGLIHGSTGLIYFVHQFAPEFKEWALLDDPEMLAAVTATNQQIKELAPVLNSPTIPDGATVDWSPPGVPIACMVKHYQGATYLFAVGMRNGTATGTFSVKDVPAQATAEVLGEGRTIKVANGTFADTFAAYDVHLYRIK